MATKTSVPTATCNSCNATFTLSTAARHICQDEYQANGQCEDFPCCGHRRGECSDRAEYTAAYWQELRDKLGDEDYERYCEILDAQEQGY